MPLDPTQQGSAGLDDTIREAGSDDASQAGLGDEAGARRRGGGVVLPAKPGLGRDGTGSSRP